MSEKTKQLTDKEVGLAKSMLDDRFQPYVEKGLELINESLKERGIVVGVDLQYFFQKIPPSSD